MTREAAPGALAPGGDRLTDRTNSAHLLFAGMRDHGRALLAGADDPHAELLALVWGPSFDRLHAQQLLAQRPAPAPAWQALATAADSFDGLPAPRQRRLRQLILLHRARCDGMRHNGSHAPHPAD
ncbi:hypothetical protein [Variovorax terrae]|uniref:Uncharacterized protein n=1 Tax=Variovorax terrae TaxID=2923278 RepID=A0A9X1VVT4_9BURK|nr:hypothetical protein [Variovorax terrae]MCJ0763875.1 hypothetical protein [Variovorax terrae]